MRYFLVNNEKEVTLDELGKLANFEEEDEELLEWTDVKLISVSDEEMWFVVKRNTYWK